MKNIMKFYYDQQGWRNVVRAGGTENLSRAVSFYYFREIKLHLVHSCEEHFIPQPRLAHPLQRPPPPPPFNDFCLLRPYSIVAFFGNFLVFITLYCNMLKKMLPLSRPIFWGRSISASQLI